MKLYDTVDKHSPQPMHAYIEVSIAGHKLRSKFKNGAVTKSPEYVQSLEFNKVGTSGNFTLVLFDKNWKELEATLHLGAQKVQIQYGYVDGLVSPLYECLLMTYSLKYMGAGEIISVQGIANGTMLNSGLLTLDTGTSNPAEAVKAIAKAMGWKLGRIDATKDITLSSTDNFIVLKEHPVSYINETLIPVSIRAADGNKGYVLQSRVGAKNPIVNYYIPEARREAQRTYVYYKGANNNVVDLDLQISGVLGGAGLTQGTTSAEASNVHPETSEDHTTQASTSQEKSTTGAYTHTTSDVKDIVSTGGMTPEMADAAVQNVMRMAVPYKGSITVFGDPTCMVGDTIRIIIPTSEGELCLASGLYFVSSVMDSINNGKYLTSMSIVREGVEAGSEKLSYTELRR